MSAPALDPSSPDVADFEEFVAYAAENENYRNLVFGMEDLPRGNKAPSTASLVVAASVAALAGLGLAFGGFYLVRRLRNTSSK